MTSNTDKKVIFIQNAIPPLRDGKYVLSATQTVTVPEQAPVSFAATSTFIAQGERFTIAPTEIDSVFPPNLANGEFDGVLPQVVLNRSTCRGNANSIRPDRRRTIPIRRGSPSWCATPAPRPGNRTLSCCCRRSDK